MKLYEILLKKAGWWKEKETSLESTIYNPICCKIGNVIKIDNLDYRDYRFTVKMIREYSVKNNKMTDYVLVARPIGQDDLTVLLRMCPDSEVKTKHRAVVLHLHDELQYDEGLHNLLKDMKNDEEKIFEMNDDSDPENPIQEKFWRVNNVGISHTAQVKSISPEVYRDEKDEYKESAEINSSLVEFWDFSRITNVEGIDLEEFVYVEMDKEDGMFQIWRGFEVIPERIDVF